MRTSSKKRPLLKKLFTLKAANSKKRICFEMNILLCTTTNSNERDRFKRKHLC